MGLFSKPGKSGGSGKGGRPKRRDTRSVIGPAAILRIQGFVTAASGAVRVPRAPEGSRSGSGYAQALFDATPSKPELKVIALKTGEGRTTISVGIATSTGAVRNHFTSKSVLTADNAAATAQSICAVLKDRTAIDMCTRELKALLAEPEGSERTFSLGLDRRLMIESGEGR